VQLVTLRCCSLQKDKPVNVRVTLYWGTFVLTLVGFVVLGKDLNTGAIVCLCEKLSMGNVTTFVVRGNISLTVNTVLSEILAEFTTVIRTQ
jgi:uncharacterized protein (DUF1697 family)